MLKKICQPFFVSCHYICFYFHHQSHKHLDREHAHASAVLLHHKNTTKWGKGRGKKRISSINDRSSDTRRNLNLTNSYPLIRNSVFTVFIETRSEHSISVIPKSMRRKTKLLSFIFRGGDRIGTMCLGDTMCLYEIRGSFSKYLRWFKYCSYDNRNKPYPLCVKNIQFNTTFTEQCNTIVSLRIFFARWAAVPDFHFWVPFNSLLWSRLFLELELN